MTTAIKTFKQSTNTKSGSYWHMVEFRPMGDGTVEVTDHMRDEMLGNWMDGNGEPRRMSLEDARAYYRKNRRCGYRCS